MGSFFISVGKANTVFLRGRSVYELDQALEVRMKPTDRVVIVGAGVFGLTTALELHHQGFKDITVLDRTLPPVC